MYQQKDQHLQRHSALQEFQFQYYPLKGASSFGSLLSYLNLIPPRECQSSIKNQKSNQIKSNQIWHYKIKSNMTLQNRIKYGIINKKSNNELT